MEPILTLDHLSYAYHTLEGETKALSDISLSVKPGEFVAIVGPSGCGKSTLLSMLWGLTQPEGGTTDRRSFETGRGGDSAQWKIIKRKRDQHWLYAAARSSF